MILLPTSAISTASSWLCSACRRSQKPLSTTLYRSLTSNTTPQQLRRKLPETPARTRFAPSPTGYLHLGSLRTALYNYLLAKASGGQFLLRIEDTDQSRTVPDALERICRDLEWAGLQWDEGPEIGGPHGPYIQSERTEIYKEHANKLLESGHAYRCFCTTERLQELAQMRSKLGLPTDYDRTCMGISKDEAEERAHRGERHAIRLKAPDAYPAFEDLIYGRIGKPKRETRKLSHGQQIFEDPILLKSDGHPTYHLANVVDDHLMKITHVIRAVEWTPSTPKHIYLYKAFGWTPPVFAHVGLLQGLKNQKLSKRSGDIDIDTYRQNGAFPEALINFVALLGWHHRRDSDVMNMNELIKVFDLGFTKGNTVVNFPKLDYLTREYSKKYTQEEGDGFAQMQKMAVNALRNANLKEPPRGQDMKEYVGLILKSDPSSYSDLTSFAERHRSFFEWDAGSEVAKNLELHDSTLVAEAVKTLQKLGDEDWTTEAIDAAFQQAVAARFPDLQDPKQSKKVLTGLMQDLRRIVFAGRKGPGLAVALPVLGRAETLDRLEKAGPY